ncbi:hypothetical protein [Sphaerisporangium fuscum]|nr:hypothetical protein [Sphaerisporangium fuscum]
MAGELEALQRAAAAERQETLARMGEQDRRIADLQNTLATRDGELALTR